MKILITGASGGLGSHLIEAFTAAGHEVTGLTRTAGGATHLKQTNAHFVRGDVTDKSSLTTDMFQQDCIVHTVAKVGGSNRWRDHLATDLDGTANVLDAAIAAGCPRFIHISSIAVLDLPTDGRAVADHTPLRAQTGRAELYVRSKQAVENLVRRYEQEGHIGVTIVRPSIFLGRYDRHTTPSIARFLQSPLAGLIGTGDNVIPCVQMDELALLVVKAAETARTIGQTYHVSGQQSIRLADLLAMHATATGRPPRRQYSARSAKALAAVMEGGTRLFQPETKPLLDRFMVDVATMNCTVNCSRAQQDLNWSGCGDLRQAIQQSLNWQEENPG